MLTLPNNKNAFSRLSALLANIKHQRAAQRLIFTGSSKRKVYGWLGILALLLIVLSLSSCSMIPIMVPDMARSPMEVPRLKGAHGPLSKSKSEKILTQLAQTGTENHALMRHIMIEEAIAGSPLVIGNRVQLLRDGPETYRAMYAAIMAAKDHINMETYILDDDEVGHRFANALIAKQQQGVQVNLIHDSFGTINTPDAFFQKLKDHGINVLEFNPINPLEVGKRWGLNQRNHRKLLIVDGKVAFLGGINISSVYSGGSFKNNSRPQRATKEAIPSTTPTAEETSIQAADQELSEAAFLAWRDTDVKLEGPVVAEFQKLFMKSWNSQKVEPLAGRNYYPPLRPAGQAIVRAIGSAPDEAYSEVYATLLSAIGNAESSIYLTNAYFVPDPQFLEALEDAAKRGVRVMLILPSKSDSALVFHAGRYHYGRLLRAGVKIYERQGVILHAKTALIDGVWGSVGSTNLDWRSFVHNYELNAIVLGEEFGKQLRQMFEDDRKHSQEITLAMWNDRSLLHRFKEVFSHLWAYWL